MNVLHLVLALLPLFVLSGPDDTNMRIVEGGGAGTWKAVIVEPASLPGVRIYAPANLRAAADKTSLPVVLFEGPDKETYEKYLNQIASSGYVVVHAAGQEPDVLLDILRVTPEVYSGWRGDLIDWDHVAVISTIGADTILPSQAPATVIYLHSSGPSFQAPYLFLVGGMDFELMLSVEDRFSEPEDVFVAAAIYPAGAEGTFSEPFGGSYAMLTVQWLEWRLKDITWARTIFTGEDCICVYTGWGIKYKNENTVLQDQP